MMMMKDKIDLIKLDTWRGQKAWTGELRTQIVLHDRVHRIPQQPGDQRTAEKARHKTTHAARGDKLPR